MNWIPIEKEFPPPDEELLLTIETLGTIDGSEEEIYGIYLNEVCVGSCEVIKDTYDEEIKDEDLRIYRYAYDFEDEWQTCDVTDKVKAWMLLPQPYEDDTPKCRKLDNFKWPPT